MKLLQIALMFFCVTSFAQSKVGTIDVDFILSKMPELTGVQQQTQEYTKSLDADLQKKVAAFQKEMEAYKQNEATMTLNQRKAMQDSIVGLETDINKFRQNGNQLIAIKSEEFMQPLYTKVGAALEKVAEANGYTQVLLRSDQVVYLSNEYDVTIAVLKELGIEIKPE